MTRQTLHKTTTVSGLSLFYREAGDPGSPTLVLLGGFPASSHQFRDLIPVLAERFHVVSPDYPGFGNTDMPQDFQYTFDRMSEVVEEWLVQIGFTSFGLYHQDYGGPIGNRILGRHPQWLQWQVRTVQTEGALAPFLEIAGLKLIYTSGHPDPEVISPDIWNMDFRFLERPGARRVQLDLLEDYKTNPPMYATWQAFLREHQPKTLILWGQGDIFFTPAGGEAYLRDLPDAEIHRLDSGHFAVEDSLDTIAGAIVSFYDTRVAVGS